MNGKATIVGGSAVPNSKRARAAANIPVSAVTWFDGEGNYYTAAAAASRYIRIP